MTTPAVAGAVRRLPVHWPTAVTLAVALAYLTGFWLTSLEGAVGAIANAQRPFVNWLLHSTLMLPVYLLAVVGALVLAHRRLGAAPRTRSGTALTGLLVAGVGTAVGVIQVAAAAVYDYRLQVIEIAQSKSSHFHTVAPGDIGTCDPACAAQGLTLGSDVRGAILTSGLLLVTNLVLVGWITAARGGRLDPAPPRRPTPAIATGAPVTDAGGPR